MNEAAPMADPNQMAAAGANPNAMMGADPNAMSTDPNAIMGGDPNAMGADPNAMGADPNAMGVDPSAMGVDPSSGNELDQNQVEKTTGDLFNLISNLKEPNEELDNWVKGMIDSALEKRREASLESGEEEPETEPQMPVESVTMTKGRFKQLHEISGIMDDELNKKSNRPKKAKKNMPKTPFTPPKFK